MIKLKITNKAYLKLKYFVENVDTEISGLGKVRIIRDELEVYDFDIFKQEVSSVHSDLDEKTLVKFLFDKTKKEESVRDYKVWWHSHGYMEAFFSYTDNKTINHSTEFPYLISIVTNKEGDNKARLDLFNPLRLTIPLEVKISLNDNKRIKKQCQKEIKEKIRKQAPKPSILKDKKKYLTPKLSKRQFLLLDSEISDHTRELH